MPMSSEEFVNVMQRSKSRKRRTPIPVVVPISGAGINSHRELIFHKSRHSFTLYRVLSTSIPKKHNISSLAVGVEVIERSRSDVNATISCVLALAPNKHRHSFIFVTFVARISTAAPNTGSNRFNGEVFYTVLSDSFPSSAGNHFEIHFRSHFCNCRGR